MAAKIVVLKDNQSIQEHVLDKETTVVGRQKECDIYIADPAVSAVHARILKHVDHYEIKDLSSTNGIHVQGKRVKQHTLRSQDIVTVGQHQLRFMQGEFVTEAAPKAAQEPESEVAVAAPQPDTNRTAHLVILTGRDKKQRIELTEQLTSVGVPGVQMAAVSQRRQGHYIVHVDGGKDRNRVPHVNGEPIGFNSRKLEDGDKIEVADMAMLYILSDGTVMGVT
jgi:pSer/pThr/pTyr-binding forkhead associated (FHA) protein